MLLGMELELTKARPPVSSARIRNGSRMAELSVDGMRADAAGTNAVGKIVSAGVHGRVRIKCRRLPSYRQQCRPVLPSAVTCFNMVTAFEPRLSLMKPSETKNKSLRPGNFEDERIRLSKTSSVSDVTAFAC